MMLFSISSAASRSGQFMVGWTPYFRADGLRVHGPGACRWISMRSLFELGEHGHLLEEAHLGLDAALR